MSRRGRGGRGGSSGSIARDINVLALENVCGPGVEYAEEEGVTRGEIKVWISALPTEVHGPFVCGTYYWCYNRVSSVPTPR